MEILSNINQLYDLLNDLFKLKVDARDFDNQNFKTKNEDLIQSESEFSYILNENFLKQNEFALKMTNQKAIEVLSKQISKIDFKNNDMVRLSNLIFQLNNFIPLLCNIVKLFLVSHKFEEVFIIVNKIFVSHIGNKIYHSKCSASFAERKFDRFVEIIEVGNFDSSLYLPFLISIYKSDRTKPYFVWKNPALEFLQNFWQNQTEKELNEFISGNIYDKHATLSAVLEFNVSKGIKYLIEDYISKSEFENEIIEQIIDLMKLYKKDVINYINHEMPKTSIEMQEKMVEVLLAMNSDEEVQSQVEFILKNTQNQNIKSLISEHMGISENLNKKTEKQFLNAVRREIKEPQHRIFGVSFDKFNLKFISGYPADDAVYTFLIDIFKKDKKLVNLSKLETLYKIFERESLLSFVKRLFKILIRKEDINQAKWVLRMSARLGDRELDNEILMFILQLFKEKRYKEGRYLMLCMIYSKKIEVLNVLKDLVEEKNEYILENLESLIELISNNCCNIEIEDIKDHLVINHYDEKTYEREKERLYNAFICEKKYTIETFKRLFINNNIFNRLAQGLIFGEYLLGKLQNAFIIKDKTIEFLIGEPISLTENSDKIEIVNDETFIKKFQTDNENHETIIEKIENHNEVETEVHGGFVVEKHKKVEEEENIIIPETSNGIIAKEKQQKVFTEKNENQNNASQKTFISIIHPLDCDFKFEKIFNYYKNPTFQQFKKTKIHMNEFTGTCFSINKFIGIIVEPKKFCDYLFQYGFKRNKAENETEFNSIVHIMPAINLICEVEFDQIINSGTSYANLGNIYFYKFDKTLCANQKFLTKNLSVLNVNLVPYRYLDYIVGLIHEASRLKGF